MATLEAKSSAIHEFTPAEIGALAHLYRGEVYRSTVWRTRLDNITNWAVAGLGLALSVSFSHAEASALPLLLIGILIVVFLIFETRRYRYFNVWRARARWMETNFYAPMLRGKGSTFGGEWEEALARDYCEPQYHISLARAVGRRLRRPAPFRRGLSLGAALHRALVEGARADGRCSIVARTAGTPVTSDEDSYRLRNDLRLSTANPHDHVSEHPFHPGVRRYHPRLITTSPSVAISPYRDLFGNWCSRIVNDAIARARQGDGPSLIDAQTYWLGDQIKNASQR